MNTDKELLENAAKSIGMTLRYNYLGGRDANQPWNPLDDDGDAFRLAAALNICVVHDEPIMIAVHEYNGYSEGEYERGVEAWIVDKYDASTIEFAEIYGDDKDKATRLAIVKVAAEIGKKL